MSAVAPHVAPVEAAEVPSLGGEAAAELGVVQHANGHLGEGERIAGAEAQPDLVVGDDLAKPAGVGDDAGAAGRHRLQRDQAEGLVDRGDHADVGDPVERVQDVVSDPADERPVLHQAEFLGLAAELLLVRA
jgi:hypothetical protein